MPTTTPPAAATEIRTCRARWGVPAFAVAAVLFLLYPVVRPYGEDAAALASPAWLASHLFAVAGFLLLTIGVGSVWLAVSESDGERPAFRALLVTGLGAGLTLPYYGAEVFGLHALGRSAQQRQDPGLLELAEVIRYGPAAAVTFLAGLALLAVGPVLAAVAIRRSALMAPAAGIPLAVGFLLFLPQFFGAPPVRMAHGLLLAAGCAWVAVELRRATR